MYQTLKTIPFSLSLSLSLSSSQQNTLLVYVPERYTKLLNLSLYLSLPLSLSLSLTPPLSLTPSLSLSLSHSLSKTKSAKHHACLCARTIYQTSKSLWSKGSLQFHARWKGGFVYLHLVHRAISSNSFIGPRSNSRLRSLLCLTRNACKRSKFTVSRIHCTQIDKRSIHSLK